MVWEREHWPEMDWLFEKGNKKRINVHATWYKFAKCNLDRCKEQHSNNISIIISEKIKQQTKELFALIKFQERYRCGIWTCLEFIQNLRHPQNGFFKKLYLSTHITLIFFWRPSPLHLPLYHSLKSEKVLAMYDGLSITYRRRWKRPVTVLTYVLLYT